MAGNAPLLDKDSQFLIKTDEAEAVESIMGASEVNASVRWSPAGIMMSEDAHHPRTFADFRPLAFAVRALTGRPRVFLQRMRLVEPRVLTHIRSARSHARQQSKHRDKRCRLGMIVGQKIAFGLSFLDRGFSPAPLRRRNPTLRSPSEPGNASGAIDVPLQFPKQCQGFSKAHRRNGRGRTFSAARREGFCAECTMKCADAIAG